MAYLISSTPKQTDIYKENGFTVLNTIPIVICIYTKVEKFSFYIKYLKINILTQ